MPRPLTLSVGILVLLAGLLPATGQQMAPVQFATPEQASQSARIRQLLPAVVSITTRKDVPQSADPGANAAGTAVETQRFYGSGFVIDASGVIVTNFHVVEDAWEIDVGFADGTRVPAQLYKATRLIDVALLKVDVGHPLPVLKWGDSDKLEVGDPVFAVGNALGVGISVSGGLVSALNRNIMDSPYDDFIQTDASINHGNSGGPLFNAQGEVVGIDTALISPTSGSSGVGFAIPANSAQNVINRLINYGWLRPGWIGMKIQQVTPEIAVALGMQEPRGSIVAYVTPDGPAAKAGLRVGDVVLQIGATRPSDDRAALRAIAESPIGQDLTLTLWREGQPQSLVVRVQEWPRNRWDALDVPVSATVSHHHIPPDLGITLAALDDINRARFGVPLGQEGVLVTGVAAGTDAALRGLVPGDVILRVQDRTVSTAAETQEAFDAIRARKLAFGLLLVQPKVRTQPGPEWIALRMSDD